MSGLNQDDLADIAFKICQKLNCSPISENTKANILSGEEVRPAGAYAVYLDKNRLYVENRNGAGDESMRKELKEAVDLI